MGYKKFPRMRCRKFLGMGCKKFLRIGSDLFPGNNHKKISSPAKPLPLYSVHPRNFSMENLSPEILEKMSTFSPDFPRERFVGISAESWKRFQGISVDFPKNCYLGLKAFDGQIKKQFSDF